MKLSDKHQSLRRGHGPSHPGQPHWGMADMWSGQSSKETLLAMDKRTFSTIQTWCHPLSLKLSFLCDDLVVNQLSSTLGLQATWKEGGGRRILVLVTRLKFNDYWEIVQQTHTMPAHRSRQHSPKRSSHTFVSFTVSALHLLSKGASLSKSLWAHWVTHLPI